MDLQSLSNQPILNPTGAGTTSFLNGILNLLHGNTSYFTIPSYIYFISYVLSLFGLTMAIYCLVRMFEIYYEELGHLRHAIADVHARDSEGGGARKNAKWEHIQDLVNSPNHSDWRLAIIEADTVLESLLEARDIPGFGIGEKLKNISPGDLGSMQAAWEAHLVRNRIAHEGSDYEITQVSARRTIQLYETVFREMGFV